MSEVLAIKSLNDIAKIKSYLKKNSDRDYTLFVLGINVGLRASDLLALKVSDIYTETGKVKEELKLTEKKTDKNRTLFINESAAEVLNKYYKSAKFLSGDEFIFQSQKGSNQPLEVRSLNRLVKQWCRECHIKGNFGTHSLRKTFGYHLYIKNSENPFILPYLSKIFNHSSQAITLRYIGIEKENIDNLYGDLNL